jgi:hypothetical protein
MYTYSVGDIVELLLLELAAEHTTEEQVLDWEEVQQYSDATHTNSW